MYYPTAIKFNQVFPSYDVFNSKVIEIINKEYPKGDWHNDDKMYTIWQVIYKQFMRKYGTRYTRFENAELFTNKLINYLEDYLLELFIVQQIYTSADWNVFNDINSLGDLRTRNSTSDGKSNTTTDANGTNYSADSPTPFNKNKIEITDDDKIKNKTGNKSTDHGTADNTTHNESSVTDKDYNPVQNLTYLLRAEITLKINIWLQKFEVLFRQYY